MKKFIIIICVLFCVSTQIKAQGATLTPYDTSGWSMPAGYSQWYHFYIYTLLSNPGGRINLNTQKMDSLFHALVVYTDTSQMYIKHDTLFLSNYMSGQHSFTSTLQYDTVSVVGLDSLDVVTVSVREAIPTANDALGVKLKPNKIIVERPSGGTSGLKYNYIWIRRN